MRRILLLYSLIASIQICEAQVGINTTSPEGALDVVALDQGIVVPRVSALENVTTPDGSPPVDGTIVYDLSRNQMCRHIAGAWACTSVTGNTTTIVTETFDTLSNYIKASNTDAGDGFGFSLDLSADGNTLVVGAFPEGSNATGINGNQADNSAAISGAVYVYIRSGSVWMFDSYIKASNTEANDRFGFIVSINGDGTLIAVGATAEDGNTSGINGDESNNDFASSGAVYIYSKNLGVWSQEAYIKASNTASVDIFGVELVLSDDGNRLAVGAPFEDSNATGVNGNQTDNSAATSGAVYVFLRTSGVWSQEAYIKASNTEANDRFGFCLSMNSNGSYLAVGAGSEDSSSTGVNGNSANNAAPNSGAVYVFTRSGTTWAQDAYLKASNTEIGDSFGISVNISGDGGTIAVGAEGEDSAATGVNGDQLDNTASSAGAVYIFTRQAGQWTQSAYIKASNPDLNDLFGAHLVLSQDGNVLLASSYGESSSATGINGDQLDNIAPAAGAVYSFIKLGNEWVQSAYIKASNTDANDRFGYALALNFDGSLAAIGADEASNATGVGGDQTDNSAANAGAVYIVE